MPESRELSSLLLVLVEGAGPGTQQSPGSRDSRHGSLMVARVSTIFHGNFHNIAETLFMIRSLDVQYNIVGTFNREKVSLDFIYKLGLPDVGAQLPPHLGDGAHTLRPREVPEEVLVEVLVVRVENVVATVQPFSFLCYPRMGFLNK